MLAYVTIGISDIHRAVKFYEPLANELGADRLMGSEEENFIAWSGANYAPGIGILHPHDGKPATVGNGMMVALQANGPKQVKALYDLALANGGTCEGEPGPRGEGAFYAGYFRDPDGNKFSAFCMTQPS